MTHPGPSAGALVAQAPATLPSPSNFEAYARAVQQWPVLSAERERDLIQAWRDRGDRDAARDLVASHLRLVVRVVRDHRGYGLSQADLAQEGTVGLMRAVHRFDPSVGVRLAAYAVRWIEAEIREFIFRNWRLVRLGSSAAMRKLFFGYRQTMEALRAMKAPRQAGIGAAQVAQALGLTAAQVDQVRLYFGGRDLALEAPWVETEGGWDEAPSQALMLEALPDDTAGPAAQAEEDDRQQAMKTAVGAALAELPERDRAILVARRLDAPPVGLAELGERWGISAERVRQIEARAAQRMALALQARGAHALVA